MMGAPGTVARLVLVLSIALSTAARVFPSTPPEPADNGATLRAFAAIHPVDVHVHLFKNDPSFQSMLERLNLKVLNILVVDDTNPYRKQLQPQIDNALNLMRSSHGHIALCTTFDPYKFNSATFADDAIKQIDRDFAKGAVAVKIWKNIGMEIKDKNGRYVMADDPKFEPIYEDIAKHGKTLMSNQAEPDVAWGPPDASDPSWSYYQENPQWYVGNPAGFPSKQKILEARDHVLANNPQLRMIGVHLGSMERDLDNLSRHLDEYPNFAVDTAGRMEYLMLMPPEKVSAFLANYQDRILYGTDLDLLLDAKVQDALKEWELTTSATGNFWQQARLLKWKVGRCMD